MIDLLPSSEQQQIGDSVRSVLADSKMAAARSTERTYALQYASSLWNDLAQLGCFGIGIPESDGGSGLSIAEEILILREFGRYLVSPAALATMLAAHIAARAGHAALLSDLLTGVRRAAIVSPFRESRIGEPGNFHLIDAEPAHVAVGWSREGAGLFEISDAKEPMNLKSLDPTIKLSRATLERPAIWIPASETPYWQRAMIYLGALQTGMIEEVRDLSVEYAKNRQQFGHPIGMFQAIKHKCATMALWGEAAWSQTVWAALQLRAEGQDAAFQATNSAAVAAEAALESARDAVQIYGGMGFTTEVPVHLYLKRAHVTAQLVGDPAYIIEQLVELPLQG
jgi:alkylation response protein AidB-like acyl-CoA dehydrogenase